MRSKAGMAKRKGDDDMSFAQDSAPVLQKSCRSNMLRQEELTFIKALFKLEFLPALHKNLRMALSSRTMKTAASARSRSTAPGAGPKAFKHPLVQNAGKRQAN
jgi:hypothetical protein